MSFDLYGPVFRLAKSSATTTYKEMTLKFIGLKLYVHGQYLGVGVLDYDGTFTKIKDTDDFSRHSALHLLRLGQTQVEHYFGYGDGNNPRCPTSTGTCQSELEKCTDDGTCNVICPPNTCNCNGCNFGPCYYDSITGKLFCSSHGTGYRIYRIDPVNGYEDDWLSKASGVGSDTEILPYDDTYFYLLVYNASATNASLYKCKWDTLRNEWKATTNIEDSCTPVNTSLGPLRSVRNVNTIRALGGWRVINWDTREHLILHPDGTTTSFDIFGSERYLDTDYIVAFDTSTSPNTIKIYDVNGTLLQTIRFPSEHPISVPGNDSNQTSFPLVGAMDSNGAEYALYLLRLNGYAPVIQVDPSTRKFRVIDLVTGQPITAKVNAYCSDIGYPEYQQPLNITPTTTTVSDWSPLPPCGKRVVTLYVADVG